MKLLAAVKEKLKIFERRAEWLYHPDSPGVRVLVVRGFWGRLFKPGDFATLPEAIDESAPAQPNLTRET